MPELPEVETLRQELSRAIVGKKIKKVEILVAKTIKPLTEKDFKKQVIGKEIKAVKRQAKILIIDLNGRLSLAIHLKMTGQLIFLPRYGGVNAKKKIVVGGHPDRTLVGEQPNKFTRLFLEFTDGSHLYFNDIRKFGWVRLINDEEVKNLIAGIGIEPLSKSFNSKVLTGILKRYPNRTIKQILMDQKLIAGIGNIYADESCFRARILPPRQSKTLNPAEIKKLSSAIVAILKLAIKKKGTSADTYRQLSGAPGGFVPYLKVYGRGDKPCKVCGRPIQKIRHLGRGTHFCSHCQK